MSRRLTLATCISLSLLILAPCFCVPATPNQAAPASKIDPKAKALLTEMASAYHNLKSFSCTVKTQSLIDSDGSPMEPNKEITIRFKKPNRAIAKVPLKAKDFAEFVSDGKHSFVFSLSDKKYLEKPSLLNDREISANLLQSGSFISHILSMTAPAFVAETTGAPTHPTLSLGADGMVDGVATQAIIGTGGDASMPATFTFVIGQSDHLLRSVIFHIKGMATTTETYTNVQANPDLPDLTFTLVPPKGARRVELGKLRSVP